ncbi:MAG: hypothetical protein ACT4OJ_00385 [Bacteroidota bacterium]
MKRCFIISFVLASQLITAQPAVKLYGYSQVFVPGMIPQDDVPDENGGRTIKKPHVVTNYYLFIAASPATIIQPREIWLEGKGFRAISQQLVKTPVMSDYPEKKTLVAATKLKVTQLTLGDSLPSSPKPTQTLRRLTVANQFVLVYSWKGKRYYTVIKKLTVLSPVHGV